MEDEALLSKLGVTAAKAEDVERDVIAHIEQESKGQVFDGPDDVEDSEPTTSHPQRDRIRGQLATLHQEIDAVQAGLGRLAQADDVLGDEQLDHDDSVIGKRLSKGKESADTALHSTLAHDRLKTLRLKKKQLRAQLRALDKDADPSASHKVASGNQPLVLLEDHEFDAALDGLVETERDRLIRIGALTPFDKVKGFERRVQPLRNESRSLEQEKLVKDSVSNAVASLAAISRSRASTKLLDSAELPKLEGPTREFRRLRKVATGKSGDDGNNTAKHKRRRPLPDAKWRKRKSRSPSFSSDENDDDDEKDAVSKRQKMWNDTEDLGLEIDDIVLEGGLKIPGQIYDKLFDYQKTGVKWLWELHSQKAGGIIGDEMGLGKTIQVIAFLAALHHSGMYRPSIIVCPVTLLFQWRREVQKWYPKFEAEIVHDSAGPKRKKSAHRDSDGSEDDSDEPKQESRLARWDALIERVVQSDSGLIVTTYEQLRLLRDRLLDVCWGYAVLDEGHRIRNPDAETTLICKQLQTVHRIIMTGAPIQNKLTELWSLFDFVFPGKLGVLPVFQAQFAVPIAIGGYANATPLQVSTAYKCAVVLRDLIMPYLLRRMKSDVEANLTKKTEHVLFCSLTEDQRAAYRAFLASADVEQIIEGSRNPLYGIDILRKICNHPDLLEREHSGKHPDYGKPERSGKLMVVAQVLSLWKTQGHRVLIFCQTQQMLDIMENFMVSQEYVYRRMDGSTPIRQRMALIDEFNESSHVFVFLLTTKVGGLGTNLIGANRVIIFDPDWNPSTDMQARERAWRIGQTRDVTIYRLITRGTIEEKVYHRQIYKQFLTNRILRDPQQRRIFKSKDMRDLFVLQEDTGTEKTETSTLFADLTGVIKLGDDEKKGKTSKKKKRSSGKNKAVCEEDPNEGGVKKTRQDEAADESRILESLFQANGIHSAMDHDAILAVNDPERMKVNFEASRVAQKAAEALQQSRMSRIRDGVAVPTWTGHSGAAGAPAAARKRFGAAVNSRLLPSSSEGAAGASSGRVLSSSELLTQMRERQLSAFNAGVESGSGHHELLLRQLTDFLKQNGGSVSSTKVVDHFKSKIPQSEVPLFKHLLNEIAILKKESGESRWFLKPDY